MTGHHGKSHELAWSRLACSPGVFSHFMHAIFLSCPPLISFTKYECSWVGGPLWTSWSFQAPFRSAKLLSLFRSYSHLITGPPGTVHATFCQPSLCRAWEDGSDRRHEARQHPWPGSLLVIDIWLRINPGPSSLIWQLRIFLHQSYLASNSSTVQRRNWGIFTKQNWEAGWNSSSRSDGRIHIF